MLKAFSMANPKFWKGYIVTMRPYLMFVSGAAGAVGLAYGTGWHINYYILGFIPLFLSYGFGQALTDCFQTDTDSISSPYRPLVKGEIGKRQVLAVSLAGLVLSVSVLLVLNFWIALPGILAVTGLLTYTYFKRKWWGGPVWNAWIVALLPVMGIMTVKGTLSISFFLAIAAVFFAYANFVIIGYFKDISADLQTGYRTLQVAFGWKTSAIVSDCTALTAAAFTFFSMLTSSNIVFFSWIVFGTAVLTNVYGQIKIHLIHDEGKSFGPIVNIVRAFILYCTALTFCWKPGWLVAGIVYYGLFEIFLKIRPSTAQI